MNFKNLLEDMYQGRTLVFGHRGASAYAPMNTLPAFELAAVQGADGIELDVHRSADGHAVIVHDFTVDKTTDGKGSVTAMTLAQLKALDAGNWFDPRFQNTPIPTLDEVFEAVGNKLFINVEIKSKSNRSDGIEGVVAEKIARFGMQKRVIVSSFNPLALRRFRQSAPNVPIGYLYVPKITFFTRLMMSRIPHEARHPYHSTITAPMMTWAKQRGYRVNTWTVNDPERAVALRDLGVNAIITDKPDIILAALKNK
ncbi:MAG: glycerophosphodiester phosphodiesterase [Chitinophagaceae bacterium]|nr:glycerophosphodiester phosphodiesterase [Anaerolineae bacterium]